MTPNAPLGKARHGSWRPNAKGILISSIALFLGIAGLLFLINLPLFQGMKPGAPLQKVVFSGSASDGTVIDCHGGWFNGGKPTELIIQSDKSGGRWDRPSNITIRNCRIRGSIRIMGMGRNGEATEVRKSSIREGHTSRAQAAAPTRILISGVEIEADRTIPFYLAPGVTHVTLENSKLTGWSVSVGVYLDAESGHNTIRNNTFALRPGREIIAVDGSADNRIEGNRFEALPHGGIYLYRNCGEGGTVRHQTPTGNIITDNYFDTRTLGYRAYGIWLGSRNGRQIYCHLDAGHPFGSSVDNRDFAEKNTVVRNVFTPATPRDIRDNGRNNLVEAKQSPAKVP